MIKIICGPKGSGKTKRIIDAANGAVDTAKGHLIFITDTNRTHLDHIIRRVGKDYRTWTVKNGCFTLAESAGKETHTI